MELDELIFIVPNQTYIERKTAAIIKKSLVERDPIIKQPFVNNHPLSPIF